MKTIENEPEERITVEELIRYLSAFPREQEVTFVDMTAGIPLIFKNVLPKHENLVQVYLQHEEHP